MRMPCHTGPVPRTATGETSLARAVRILDAFTPDEPALGVTEIARRAGLHVATASRLVAELASTACSSGGRTARCA